MKVSLCILIPFYNESNRIKVEKYRKFITNSNSTFFCFIDDGSNDQTFDILCKIREYSFSKIIILRNIQNKGKAETIRHGMLYLNSHYDFNYIGYLDADLSTPFEGIYSFLTSKYFCKDIYLFLGDRSHLSNNTMKRKRIRLFFNKVLRIIVCYLFKIPVHDTQVGAKVIKTDIIDYIFFKPFLSKWLFDIEIILRIMYYRYEIPFHKKIREIPLSKWQDVNKSKIKIFDLLKMPFELLQIYIYYELYRREIVN